MRLSKDLRKRTKALSSSIIRLFEELPVRRPAVEVLGRQLLRSGTSVAAHAREASRARSDAEFCSKLDVLLQEAVRVCSGWNISKKIAALHPRKFDLSITSVMKL